MDFLLSIRFSLGIAALMGLTVWRARRNWRTIPTLVPQPKTHALPDCMVVIPARDEEDVIAKAVQSLPHDSVIVVDDRSTDKTADVAQNAGAGVLKSPTLIRGGNGKSNACAEGARVIQTKWILFADADAWFEPDFLASAIAAAEAAKADFLSVYLRPEYQTWKERALGPLALLYYFFGLPSKPAATDVFNGQCILVRRQAYEFVGGHGSIVKDLNDDLKLAALALRHRMRIAVARSGDLGHVRIRTEGFTRQAYRFTQVSLWIGLRILAAAAIFGLWWLAETWLLSIRQYAAASLLYAWLVLVLGIPYRSFHQALLAPFSILWLGGILIRGLFAVITGRPVHWKGRVI